MTTLLTAAELAERLGISKSSVLRLARAGTIPAHRLGPKAVRFALVDVLAATMERPAVKAPAQHPKVTQLSPEAHELFYGRQARGGSRTTANKTKAARSS